MKFEELIEKFYVGKGIKLPLSKSFKALIDNYEFTAYVLEGADRKLYAFVSGADSDRSQELDQLFQDEIQMKVINWYVLNEFKDLSTELYNSTFPAKIDKQDISIATHYADLRPVWLLQVAELKNKAS